MKQYKNTVQTIQNTVNTSTHITKTPTHYKTYTYTHAHVRISEQAAFISLYNTNWFVCVFKVCMLRRGVFTARFDLNS